MRTFEVSPVEPSTRALPSVSLFDALEQWHDLRPEACGANLGHLVWPNGNPFVLLPDERELEIDLGLDDEYVIDRLAHALLPDGQPIADAGDPGGVKLRWRGNHPLLDAIHTAFAWHYPLTLSPDDVWLCIAQGFAYHVQQNAEALRSRFVRHEGKERIVVRRDDFIKGSPDNDWQGCLSQFSDAIAEHIGKKRDLVVASFSTTGPVERAASEIVLMDAMFAYFDYEVCTRCGIPRITLLGTVDDWRSTRRRAEVFAEFDLGDWVAALLPVLDQFVAAAGGTEDRAFWRSLYKLNDVSGGPYVTGWINVLFPYLLDCSAPGMERNEYALTWADAMADDDDTDNAFGGGPTLGTFPRGLSRAPFIWDYLGTRLPMELLGGFAGVSQDPETWAVRPVIGWAVRDAPG